MLMRCQSRVFGPGTRPFAFALMLLYCCHAAPAQTEFVRSNFFPAEMEFKELVAVRSERTYEEGASLAGIAGGDILSEAGCKRYAMREYEVEGGGTLSIDVATLKDPKASYSVLTLLRSSPVEKGPPGQFFAATSGKIIFAQGNIWVRIEGRNAELCRRVALSVSNRIGSRESSLPSLIRRLPREGLDPGSIEFFLGPEAFRAYGGLLKGVQLVPTKDLEIAQAKYEAEGRSGTLYLVGFPTNQAAQEYFDSLSAPAAHPGETRTYAKRAGPLVAILEGTFQPGQADKILGSLEYQYSVRWIYDKNRRSSRTIWGVPVGLLGTVVRSLAFVALLCVASILLGLAIAVVRILMRGYAPNNPLDRPERTEIIRLKLDEK
jgi:hypothetical protein